MATVVVSYGGYNLVPAPALSINRSPIRRADGQLIGTTHTFSLSGFIADRTTGQLKGLTDIMRDMRNAFNCDGKYFKVTCGADTIFEGYPRIVGALEFTEGDDNWTSTIPYTVILEFDHEPVGVNITGSGEYATGDCIIHPPYISSFNEDWQIEFDQSISNPYDIEGESSPYAMRFTHNISAVGVSHYSGADEKDGGLEKPAWQQARDYISGNLGFDESIFLSRVGLNLPTGASVWNAYDYYRTNNVGQSDGTYSVSENWLVLGSRNGQAAQKAVENFTIDHNIDDDNGLETCAIQGTIQGLEERNYNGTLDVTATKYNNASGYWDIVQDRIATRIENVSPNTTRRTSRAVGHNYNGGAITYNYNFDDQPAYCLTGSGVISATINVSNKNPRDVFSLLTIVGRSKGPILQSFNTKTEFVRTVSFNARFKPAVCTGLVPYNDEIESLIRMWKPAESDGYDVVRVSADDDNWDARAGNYSRTISWTAAACSTNGKSVFS